MVAEVGAASTKLVSVSLPVYARSACRIGSERQCRTLVLGLHRERGDWWEPGGSVTCLGFQGSLLASNVRAFVLTLTSER